MASSPRDVTEFRACFPDWPADSLLDRTDIKSGSKWGLRETGSFKLLRTKNGPELPESLNHIAAEAKQLVQTSQDLQAAANLLNSIWQNHNRSELLRKAGTFSPFFSLLAEVLEQSAPPGPYYHFLRGGPSDDTIEEAREQSSQSSSSVGSPPAKRVRQTNSEDSFQPSFQSDQSAHDGQVKSEFTTNACVCYFLQCVTESTRNNTYGHSFRLEWALTQHTFAVKTPACHFTSTNDGNLVCRDISSGFWARSTHFSYCSIEAKSRYNLTSPTVEIEAQEGAHIIGMLNERLSNRQERGSIGPSEIIPLISARQNMFYVVIGTFPEAYWHYLEKGVDSQQAFGQLDECGPFDMKLAGDFQTFSSICIALVLHLERLCALRP